MHVIPPIRTTILRPRRAQRDRTKIIYLVWPLFRRTRKSQLAGYSANGNVKDCAKRFQITADVKIRIVTVEIQ
ncbi:MAG: hypothetical protein CL534_15870 [Ahrensia sp.]|nr:hypothetical protein [Ahrensia sp.]